MNIYFCGSMTFDHSKADDYKEMINRLENYGHVLNKFVGDKQVHDLDAKDVFLRDTSNLNKADILVADVSVVSMGVGFEIGYFVNKNKPMLILYDKNKPLPSASVRGISNSKLVGYASITDALNSVDEFMKNIK